MEPYFKHNEPVILNINNEAMINDVFFFSFVFNALLTQKIVTTGYKNRKVKREKKKRIKPTHTARQDNSLKKHKAAKKLRYKSVKEVDYTC